MTADVVVDTDVLSFLFKEDSRAEMYRPHLIATRPVISLMTHAELLRWPMGRGWGEARLARLHAYLRQFIMYGCDADLCRVWAEVTHAARDRGRPVQCADAWIAATALLHGMPLLTHNGRDYAGVPGLRVICEAG